MCSWSCYIIAGKSCTSTSPSPPLPTNGATNRGTRRRATYSASETAALDQNTTQWVVNISLNGEATKAFGTLTTNQYNNYYPSVSTNSDDAVLDSTAIVLEGHELGHVHPDRGTLDMPLPDDRRTEVLNAARAKEWFSGWVSKPLANDADAQDGIALLRGSYDELRTR